MSKSVKTWLFRILKLTLAVGGLWWVISKTPWHNQATLREDVDFRGYYLLERVDVTVLLSPLPAESPVLSVRLPDREVKVRDEKRHESRQPLASLFPTGQREIEVRKDQLQTLNTGEVKIQVGLRDLIRRANPWYLLAAWAVLGLPFLITSWRWMKLMRPQGIDLPYAKCLALTFVGQFYSTFLPGITGGDLVKIIYASKVTGSKTKSTVTVLLDRVIGLVALLMIAGISSVVLLIQTGDETIRNVAILSWAILGGMAVGTALYFSRRVRRILAIDRLTESAKERLAARAAARERGETVADEAGAASKFETVRRRVAEVVVQFDDALHVYRGHLGVLAVAFGVSLQVQLISPLSAYLAGQAFGMPAPIGYYFAFVPLALLAASLPIAPPQGFGFTEFIFLHFFSQRGPLVLRASTSQTFALAQAVRFLPVAWNLIGAWWVLIGTYTRHEAVEESHHDPAVEGTGA